MPIAIKYVLIEKTWKKAVTATHNTAEISESERTSEKYRYLKFRWNIDSTVMVGSMMKLVIYRKTNVASTQREHWNIFTCSSMLILYNILLYRWV